MGIGRILGGALTGYGAGLVQSSVMADEERRQVALEKLRQENRTAEIETMANFNNRNAALSDARGDTNDARKTARQTDAEIKVGGAKFQQTLTLAEVEAANRKDLAKFQSSLNMNEAQAKAALDLNTLATQSRREVGDRVIAADGSMVQYAKDGSLIGRSAPGVFSPPSSGGGGAAPTLLQQSGGSAPKPAAKPAAQPVAKAPAVKKPPATTIKFDKNGNIVK